MTVPFADPAAKPKRVLTVGPMPPEKLAYALARYSRSPDSITDSIEWVRTHDSAKFLESFYFQYGHASIADLGHLAICFEGVSELAATEIEDEQLWDGQARSSRYQDFSKSSVVTPPELSAAECAIYQDAAAKLIDAYRAVQQSATPLSRKATAPPGRDEARRLSPQHRRARVRHRALLVAVRNTHRRRPSHQHSHARNARFAA